MQNVLITRVAEDAAESEAIVLIDRICFPQATLNVAAELERPWSRLWVARQESGASEPLAFLLAWLVAGELHILSVATLPEFRRQGLARALLGHAMDFARNHAVHTILLEVRRSNSAAIQLYRGLGFSAVAVRARYYADNFEDAVEMSLEFDPATGQPKRGQDEVTI